VAVSKYKKMMLSGLTLVTLAFQSSHSLAQGAKPPIENIQNARLIVYSAIARVDSLIQQVFGGGGQVPGGEWPAPQPPQGGEFPGGDSLPPSRPFPPVLTFSGEEAPSADHDDELENDRVAGFALQGLGVGLRRLGELIDQANANYYSPSFGFYWKEVCVKTAFLVKATQGGKVSAALPLQGLITPQDFALTEQELMDVRNQFYCF
jgi:hypothetical protein